MSRTVQLTLLISLLTVAAAVDAHAEEPRASGALQQGTLANQKLIRDAMVGVGAKVATLGCSKPERFEPYVLRPPEGTPGARRWEERWVVLGCGKKFPVDILFSEDGLQAANWSIR